MVKKAIPAQIKIRLPEALRRDLEREAAKTGRTLNGEIVYRLTQPFVQADRREIATAAAGYAVKNLLTKISPDDLAKAMEAAASNFLTKISPDDLAKVMEAVASPKTTITEIHKVEPQSSKPEDKGDTKS